MSNAENNAAGTMSRPMMSMYRFHANRACFNDPVMPQMASGTISVMPMAASAILRASTWQ